MSVLDLLKSLVHKPEPLAEAIAIPVEKTYPGEHVGIAVRRVHQVLASKESGRTLMFATPDGRTFTALSEALDHERKVRI